MKAVVAAFNQEKALVGAFSVITNLRMELFQALLSTIQVQQPVQFAFQPSSYSGVASTSTAAAVQSIQSLQPLQYTTSTLGAV